MHASIFKRIEWDAYDYHSGISHLNWRLYDNFTGSDLVHGEIDLPGQGETKVMRKIYVKNLENGYEPHTIFLLIISEDVLLPCVIIIQTIVAGFFFVQICRSHHRKNIT